MASIDIYLLSLLINGILRCFPLLCLLLRPHLCVFTADVLKAI